MTKGFFEQTSGSSRAGTAVKKGLEMASKTQKTEKIRARKHAPNKDNLKTERKRIRKNLDVVQKIEKEA